MNDLIFFFSSLDTTVFTILSIGKTPYEEEETQKLPFIKTYKAKFGWIVKV